MGDNDRLVQDNPFEFEAWLAKVYEQAHAFAGSFEIVNTQSLVNIIQRFDGLQFYDHLILYQKVTNVLPHINTIIVHRNLKLLDDMQPSLAKFVRQRILVDLLQKTSAQRVTYGKCAANDNPGNPLHF